MYFKMKRDVQHNICMTRENNFKHVLGSINPIFTSLFHKIVLRKEKKVNSNFTLPLQLFTNPSETTWLSPLTFCWREAILIKVIERLQKIQYNDSELKTNKNSLKNLISNDYFSQFLRTHADSARFKENFRETSNPNR